MYIILDTQCNGAAAAAADVYVGSPIVTHINLANSSRFRIIKSWDHVWNPMAGVTTAYINTTKYINFYKKCNIPLQFSAATGAITEIRTNNLFLLAGASAAAIDDLVSINGNCRLRFTG